MTDQATGTTDHRTARPVIPYAPLLHQPYVHDITGILSAPVQAWSRPDGAMTHAGAEGIYVGDHRVVSGYALDSEDASLTPLPVQVDSARTVVFTDVVSLPDNHVDPIVTLERRRTARPDGITETLMLRSDDDRDRQVHLRIRITPDDATMSAVKDPRLLARLTGERPALSLTGSTASWTPADGVDVEVTAEGLELSTDAGELLLTATLTVPGTARSTSVSWRLTGTDAAALFTAPAEHWDVEALLGEATAGEPRPEHHVPEHADPEHAAVRTLLRRSLSDLDALRMNSIQEPTHSFLAAGAPWYFTLFGRDSLIAASLAHPVVPELAATTLRTLASRRGTAVDPETAQAPGKILHEVRAVGIDMVETYLPPVYYGTIDATPLWIDLLHRAWRAGDAALLDELHEALADTATWLLEHADADGDGLLEYIDASGHGLANQGWKDSGDSVRFADGSLAEGTIALAEVQGYAYQAALQAAQMLEHLGAGGDLPTRLRAWAQNLREAFHRSFWCEDASGPFIALALDGAKRPVDGVASNMGHLLGTGLLDATQERLVVDRLMDPTMFSGYGIRTLSTTNGGYNPVRYHGGSVWVHDTGWILRRMLDAGFDAEACVLARGLLRAAQGFEWRFPELFSGQAADQVDPPMPYPASCRPQAWAAASAVPIAQALGVLPR